MRFVIITLPPRAIRERIEALRRPLNEAVGALQALRYPPHLTLRTGLVCPDDQADEVAQSFLAHAAPLSSVRVQTEGLVFTTYGEPGTSRGLVAWKVNASPQLLELHQGLLAFPGWAKGPQVNYQPHVTLAFDDLGLAEVELLRRQIESAAPPFPDFSWSIDHVALYHETTLGWVEWDRVSVVPSTGN